MNEPTNEVVTPEIQELALTPNPTNLNYQLTAPHSREMEDLMANYLASKANHVPGKEHKMSDTTYTVASSGAYVRSEPIKLVNPNMKNNSVRRKLAKRPKKYIVAS
jgi:hypothetical protein